MTKEQFIKQFESSPFTSDQRNIFTEVVLDYMNLSSKQKEDYWKKKSKESAEKGLY